MSALHPAWRFILALKANGLDPSMVGLPQDGGCNTWNKTSRLLSNIIYEDCEDGQIEQLLQDEQHGQEYRYLYSAYRFFKLKTYRVHAETYLLSGGDELWLTDTLSIDKNVLDIYKAAFFDLSVFKNGIDRLEYINNIQDSIEREVKKDWHKGPDYIKWQMGFGVGIDAKSVLSSLLIDVYYKHKQSPDHKESSKWCDVASKIGKELIGEKDADDLKDKIQEILTLDMKQIKHKTLEDVQTEDGGI